MQFSSEGGLPETGDGQEKVVHDGGGNHQPFVFILLLLSFSVKLKIKQSTGHVQV